MDPFIVSAPTLLQGLGTTILLGVTSFALGLLLGGVIALARLSRFRVLNAAAVGYVSLFRGTPLLIQIMLVYYGLPQLGLRILPIPSAIVTFTLYAAAYLSESLRVGVLAVEKGQWEAATSLGMTSGRSLRRVIAPQALRNAAPEIGGRFISLMKDTSLASVITVVELTRVAESTGSSSFRYIEAFLTAALVYWCINGVLSLTQLMLERRMRRAYA
jgi:L-cystine transport system permease protein